MGKIIIERGWAGRNFAKASKTGDRALFPIELEQAGIMLKMHLSLLRHAIEVGELNGIPTPNVYKDLGKLYFALGELEAFCKAMADKQRSEPLLSND